jgi:hypothetical protein
LFSLLKPMSSYFYSNHKWAAPTTNSKLKLRWSLYIYCTPDKTCATLYLMCAALDVLF